MSTRQQRAWDALRESIDGPCYTGVRELRDSMTGELLEVSCKPPTLLEEARANTVCGYLLSTPVERFAVRVGAWDEFARELEDKTPTYDPIKLFKWAQSALWKFCVFIDPSEACDHDQ